MAPGDCYEQFHRYSLVKNNFYRGRFPYDSSYQYNLDRNNIFFNEGLVFFPFSLINGIVSFFFGDIISYNIMAILFYILCGIPPKKDIKSV
ncbi:MAG: hypothetical protein M0P94_03380 [Candidatus Absconditabacterales bacterium]|nr:hypothetical protein [Candidatus Absconditabacterales bacterium]